MGIANNDSCDEESDDERYYREILGLQESYGDEINLPESYDEGFHFQKDGKRKKTKKRINSQEKKEIFKRYLIALGSLGLSYLSLQQGMHYVGKNTRLVQALHPLEHTLKQEIIKQESAYNYDHVQREIHNLRNLKLAHETNADLERIVSILSQAKYSKDISVRKSLLIDVKDQLQEIKRAEVQENSVFSGILFFLSFTLLGNAFYHVGKTLTKIYRSKGYQD